LSALPKTRIAGKTFFLSSRYPFSLENPWVFGLVYFYQVFGISMSACFNASTDTLGSAMIAQVNGQVKRLGIQLTKVSEGKEFVELLNDKIFQIGHEGDKVGGSTSEVKLISFRFIA
jgi:hypothetical protein